MYVSTDEQAARNVHQTVHIYHDINYVYTRHELFDERPNRNKGKNKEEDKDENKDEVTSP
jgi:hypothetical protein